MSAFSREKTTFLSSDGKHVITGYFYQPVNVAPRAVVQISHGMCEYIRRYEPMIEILTGAGIAVCGNDHLGHGDTADPKDYGFAAAQKGWRYILDDLYKMNRLVETRFPSVPIILYGHSMGSFYARQYAVEFPDSIRGLIVSGTGGPSPAIAAGKALASLLSRVRGPRYVSSLLVSMSTGGYSKGLESDGNPHAWLSRDPDVWAAYGNDPMCTFNFSVSAYRDMLTVYQLVSKKKWAHEMPVELPIFLYSGDRDPVGAYGKGVGAVREMLIRAGVQNLTYKLYPNGRHEMHNELNKQELFDDILVWIDEKL